MRYQSFAEFWPFYLGEHSMPWTRRLHCAGTLFGLGLLIAAPLARNGWLALLAPVAGYGFAWISHALIERNKPATFTHPLWSFVGDWKMAALMSTGQIGGELEKHGIRPRHSAQPA